MLGFNLSFIHAPSKQSFLASNKALRAPNLTHVLTAVSKVVLYVGSKNMRCVNTYTGYGSLNATYGGLAYLQNAVVRVGMLPVLWGDSLNKEFPDLRGLEGNRVCSVQLDAVPAGARVELSCNSPVVGRFVSIQQNTFTGNELLSLTVSRSSHFHNQAPNHT